MVNNKYKVDLRDFNIDDNDFRLYLKKYLKKKGKDGFSSNPTPEEGIMFVFAQIGYLSRSFPKNVEIECILNEDNLKMKVLKISTFNIACTVEHLAEMIGVKTDDEEFLEQLAKQGLVSESNIEYLKPGEYFKHELVEIKDYTKDDKLTNMYGVFCIAINEVLNPENSQQQKDYCMNKIVKVIFTENPILNFSNLVEQSKKGHINSIYKLCSLFVESLEKRTDKYGIEGLDILND